MGGILSNEFYVVFFHCQKKVMVSDGPQRLSCCDFKIVSGIRSQTNEKESKFSKGFSGINDEIFGSGIVSTQHTQFFNDNKSTPLFSVSSRNLPPNFINHAHCH